MNEYEIAPPAGNWLVTLTGILIALGVSTLPVAPASGQVTPLEIVLVEAQPVTAEMVLQWKREGFKGVAVVLDERTEELAYREIARRISEGGLDIYCWIEVARNPKLATAHPRWMAALGTHEDWQKNFPNLSEPKFGEVAKAFPWVPIAYRETFDAHLARIDQLLKRAPRGWRGLLLNDLQAGPSSCGCGNVQCRWAIDYHVHPTASRLEGDNVAARFVAEVRKRTGNKEVVPVWTTSARKLICLRTNIRAARGPQSVIWRKRFPRIKENQSLLRCNVRLFVGPSLESFLNELRAQPLAGTPLAGLEKTQLQWRKAGAELGAVSILVHEGKQAEADALLKQAVSALPPQIQTAFDTSALGSHQ